MQPGSTVPSPPYEMDGTYPGTCVRLPPLNWWWAALVLLFFGFPSWRALWSMGSTLFDTSVHPAGRAMQAFGLLFYTAWHGVFLLPALYVWKGRLEFRVNVERRRVEIRRGVGPLGWTWAWGYDEVQGLERVTWKLPEAQEGQPLPPKLQPSSGFTLKLKRGAMPWGFSVRGDDAERLLQLLKHRHPMFHPSTKDPLHS